VDEMMRLTQVAAAETYRPLELYAAAAVYYYLMTLVTARAINLIERRLSRLLKCEELRGLTDALVEPELPLADIVLRTSHPNIAVVPCGIVADPMGHIATDRVAALLEGFQRDHEVVLFSGGGVPSNGLALALAPVVARVLLLAAENVTTSEDLDAAYESLRVRSARDIGLVLATRAPGT